MATPETRTPEGWELQFATNHLGHFALATGLHARSPRPAAPGSSSVSSAAPPRSPVVFDDIHFERRPYEPVVAYGQSKTANVLFAVEAHRRWADDGITVNALHPGGIRDQPAAARRRGQPGRARGRRRRRRRRLEDAEQGAATSVLLAASPLLDGVSGRYFEDCHEAGPSRAGVRRGVAAWALDPERAARLWQLSADLIARG